jgi:hypothetical protein
MERNEQKGKAKARGRTWSPKISFSAPPQQTKQENEKRYNNWVSNLEFALDYNSRTTSHWVRARFFAFACAYACARLAIDASLLLPPQTKTPPPSKPQP